VNAVDITPRNYDWAAAPGKCNDSGSCSGVKLQSAQGLSRVLVSCLDLTDRQLSSQAHHTLCQTMSRSCAVRLGRM